MRCSSDPCHQALIFDLGGVIIDLDTDRTVSRFANLFNTSHEVVKAAHTQHSFFNDLETGHIQPPEFRRQLRQVFGNDSVPDQQLDSAWNAMLVGLPIEKLRLLTTLRNHYQVYILSNTNQIHLDHVTQHLIPQQDTLDSFVHKAYYSHHMRMRKPDPEIYKTVLEEHGLRPSDALFLDDNPDNIRSAAALGINVTLVQHPNEVYTIFNQYV
jgi:putative hydrolase of the HAD superfamily